MYFRIWIYVGLFLLLIYTDVCAENLSLSEQQRKVLRDHQIQITHSPLQAKDFQGFAFNGAKERLSQYRGKPILLNFWASWCVPCLKEMPDMEKVHLALSKVGFVVLGVAMGEDAEKVKKFLDKYPFTFPIIADPNMEISEMYGVRNLPITYLIDSSGYIYARAIGPREWGDDRLLEYFKSQTILASSH